MATDQNVLRPDVPAWRAGADEEKYRSAMERAGRLLANRARTEHEMTTRLGEAGFDPTTVAAVVARLVELSLIDDLAFAREWIEERARRRPSGPRVLLDQLGRRGVDTETAREALSESGFEETAQAIELAATLVARVARRPLAEQGPRLMQMLLRRGFGYEAAEEAARAVLPPDGWD
jgi:regulatory protein